MLSKVTGFMKSKTLKSITDAGFACDECGKESKIGDMMSKINSDEFYCPCCDSVIEYIDPAVTAAIKERIG